MALLNVLNFLDHIVLEKKISVMVTQTHEEESFKVINKLIIYLKFDKRSYHILKNEEKQSAQHENRVIIFCHEISIYNPIS